MDENKEHLYRVEYWSADETSGVTQHVEWEIGASEEEIRESETTDIETSVIKIDIREATADEADAYMDGFAEGVMMAGAEARLESYNGVTYSLDMDVLRTQLEANEDEISIKSAAQKMFACGVCDTRHDYLDAAMTGNYYVSTTKEDRATLWHVCKDCA